MSAPFEFKALKTPSAWTGRYNRIAGREPAFHAPITGAPYAQWSPWQSDERLVSEFADGAVGRRLAKAVNQAKQLGGGAPGGSFQINEFGQVICPLSNGRERFLVGTVSGVPLLLDPRNPGRTFDLDAPKSTKAGTPWDKPYIGMKFALDANDSIYFKQSDGDTSRKLRLPSVPAVLVHLLRKVRSSEPAFRFIVNLHGVALTKVGNDEQPVFVGHIDLDHWFPNHP